MEFKVKKHRYFQREGNDIHVAVLISSRDANLGNQIEVLTLEGVEKIPVLPGTQNGDCYVLKNRGCYLGINKAARGNLYV